MMNDGHCLQVVETPTISLQILEDLTPDHVGTGSEEEDDEEETVEDAVGRFLWPTAKHLLRYLLLPPENNDIETEQEPIVTVIVVELGAGCGVLGMGLAAAALPVYDNNNKEEQRHVILTDHDSEWLEQNLALNSSALSEQANVLVLPATDDNLVASTNDPSKQGKTIQVAKLDWKNPDDIAAVMDKIQQIVQQQDHQQQVQLMLVGSDILYNHNSHQALASTLWQLSSSFQTTQTRIVLGFPDRDNDEASFLTYERKYWGDAVPVSKPLPLVHQKHTPRNGNGRRRKKITTMEDLRLLDFTVP